MAALRDERSHRRYALGGKFTIGRASANDLPLADDSAVSRMHAAVHGAGDGHEIEDLGSANGTFVERAGRRIRVSGRLPLQDGDVVCAGSARLVYEQAEGAAGESTAMVDAGLTQVPEQTRVGNVVPLGLPPREETGEADEGRSRRLILLTIVSALAAVVAVVVSLLLASVL